MMFAIGMGISIAAISIGFVVISGVIARDEDEFEEVER